MNWWKWRNTGPSLNLQGGQVPSGSSAVPHFSTSIYLFIKSGFIEHRLYGRLSARYWSSYTVHNGPYPALLPLST